MPANHRPLPNRWYHFGAGLTAFAATLLSRWTVDGREHVPASGPYIVVANHFGFLDPPMVATSLPRPVTFIAKAELWEKPFSRFFSESIGMIPLRRGEADRRALTESLAVLKDGGPIAIFPEGTRGTGQVGLKQGQRGVAFIALLANVPILPVAIWGTEGVPNVGSIVKMLLRFRRPIIRVKIGPTFMIEPSEGKTSTEVLSSRTDEIMVHIARLLPPEYRGVYAEQAEAINPTSKLETTPRASIGPA